MKTSDRQGISTAEGIIANMQRIMSMPKKERRAYLKEAAATKHNLSDEDYEYMFMMDGWNRED